MTDLAVGFAAAGHHVTVLTSIPHYNPPEAIRGNPVYRPRFWKPYTEAQEGPIRVIRIWMPLKKQRVWSRLLDYLWFQFAMTVLGFWKGIPCDVVFVTSPPITFGLSGAFLAWCGGASFVYDIRELWPDVPVQLGMIRNRLLVGIAYAIERIVYRSADALSTIAHTFSEELKKRGVPPSKLYFTPNFVDVEQIKPQSKANPFSAEHGLTDAFVVLYAGNIGLTQGLEILVKVAQAFRDDPKFRIVIVGDGAGRVKLEKAVAKSGLKNIQMIPFQPANRVADIYASADVSVVPLLSGFSYSTVPSKTHTSMAAGRAVLLSGEADSEAARLLEESEAGICVPPESASAMVQALRRLRSDLGLRELMGLNGRAWVVDRYSRVAVLAVYDRMIRDLVSSQSKPHLISTNSTAAEH